MTLKSHFAFLRRKIEFALDKKRLIDDGRYDKPYPFSYCNKVEADKIVLEAYDEVVQQCRAANAAGRCYEQILKEHGVSDHDLFVRFNELFMTELKKEYS